MRKTIFIINLLLIISIASIARSAPTPEIVNNKDDSLSAWLVEDQQLPIVAITIGFTNIGTAYDPFDKIGLANFVSKMLDEGTENYSAIELKKKFQEHSIKFSSYVDHDNLYIEIKTLKANLDIAFKLLNEILTTPSFAKTDIARVKEQIIAQIELSEKDPHHLISKNLNERIYGKHTYSRKIAGTKETVNNINQNSLLQYRNKNFTKNNMYMSVAGDISAWKLSDYLDKYFNDIISVENHQLPSQLGFTNQENKNLQYELTLNVPQAIIMFSLPAVTRDHPDFYNIFMMNHILGASGFESILMNKIREENGLAYSAYSYLSMKKALGVIKGYTATDPINLHKATKFIKDTISQLQQNGFTAIELSNAKKYLIGYFYLRLDSNRNIANYLLQMQINDLGIDFLQKRNSYIEQITLKELNKVAAKYLDNEKLILIVAR